MNLTSAQWGLLAHSDQVGWFSASTLEDQAECVELWSMKLLELQLQGARVGYTITDKGSQVAAALARRYLQP